MSAAGKRYARAAVEAALERQLKQRCSRGRAVRAKWAVDAADTGRRIVVEACLAAAVCDRSACRAQRC